MALGIKGRHTIVTGGPGGMGFETARQFLEEGVRVLITGRNEKKCNAARDELARRTGGEVYAAVADMTKKFDIARMVETAKEKPGGVDILVNNAGQMYSGHFAVIDDKEFQNRLDTKLFACHGRACRGHPRLTFRGQDVDARHKAGHDSG